jgi:Mce-associated membrane protein
VTEPPPESTSLTPEEWDAVRRLRERAGSSAAPSAPAPSTSEEPVAQEVPVAPKDPVDTEPSATAQPLAPLEPSPPPEQTAPPVEESVPAAPPPRTAGGERSVVGRSAPVGLPALAALVVLAVAAVVLATLLSLRVSDNHEKNQAATAALSAATTGVASVLSYNYKSLDADFAKAEALLTPSFRKSYEATTAKAVQPLAAKYKAVSPAQVSAAGVIAASPSKAKVLVFVSQQVTNTQLSAPRLDRSRIEVELVLAHGDWLINKLTPV